MKKINSRRKSRELVMKSIYRGIMNTFDYDAIKKDILRGSLIIVDVMKSFTIH